MTNERIAEIEAKAKKAKHSVGTDSLMSPYIVSELIAEVRLWQNRTDEAADVVAEFENLQAENRELRDTLSELTIDTTESYRLRKLDAENKKLKEALAWIEYRIIMCKTSPILRRQINRRTKWLDACLDEIEALKGDRSAIDDYHED